jgi:hypothetical protein
LTTNANAFSLNLFAPIVIHPTQHFFAGFGPFLDTDLSGHAGHGVRRTTHHWRMDVTPRRIAGPQNGAEG